MPVPVICVGNLVMGGAGKTPTVIALAEILKKNGKNPHILSRGYGANIAQAIKVNPEQHKASQVGDEPLLLAETAPTWVFKDRKVTGKLAVAEGADVLLLDDGFQNPSLFKDLSLLVIDEHQGLGNGEVFPAGPLRENSQQGLQRADAIVFIGKTPSFSTTKQIIKATIKPEKHEPKRVLAFTGLGFPEKFFLTLSNLGYDLADQESFPDHHPYTDAEIEQLILKANNLNAQLITTAKDLLRIPNKYHTHLEVLAIQLQFENEQLINKILMDYLK